MYQTNQNENKKLKEELEKNEAGINRIKKAAHDFSQFNLYGRERIENFKKNGITLAQELDNSFSQFPYGWVTGFEIFTKSLLEDFVDKQENENLRNQLNEKAEKISSLTNEKSQLEENLNVVGEKIKNLEKEKNICSEQVDNLKKELEKINNKTQDLKFSLSEEQKNSVQLQRKNQELQTQLEQEKAKNYFLNQQLTKVSPEEKINEKRKELEQSISNFKNRLDKVVSEDLDNLLEAREEFTKSNNSYVQKQLEKIKKGC